MNQDIKDIIISMIHAGLITGANEGAAQNIIKVYTKMDEHYGSKLNSKEISEEELEKKITNLASELGYSMTKKQEC